MSAIEIVSERIAELNNKMDIIREKIASCSVKSSREIKKLKYDYKILKELKEQNETMYMIIRGYN